jgi:hypothetical protein
MFEIAFFMGIYSYLIFFLGIFGFLFKFNIIVATIIYVFFSFLYILKIKKFKFIFPKKIRLNTLSILIVILIGIQVLVNLVGVLGPEISFDALWYHLTLPKIFLISHSILHIPGNLLYYSDIPKLTEMFYVVGLSIGNEILAKFIHFAFGILILIAIYKISRKFVTRAFSLLAVLIFYSNLVVGWESITAYVDLSRTFFEIMSFWGLINYLEDKERKWLYVSGLMLGFAITAKLISIGTILIFLGIFLYWALIKKDKKIESLKNSAVLIFSSIIIPLPWFIFSFVNTNNPIYPYFSNIAVDSGNALSLPNINNLFKDFYVLFLGLNDPISPIYLIILPIVFLYLKSFSARIKIFVIYTFLSIFIWYLTQEQRGGRFIMPYLPVFSILCVITISSLKFKNLKYYLITLVIFLSIVSIGYRGMANKKFLPYILGRQTKNEFLSKNLNFSFGEFYDIDGYFGRQIKNTDAVLLYGFHNLYYVNFTFIDSSWVKKGDKFNYIALQDSIIPSRFFNWTQIYYNKQTKVKLFSKEGKMWAY